jgi:serine/threonine protein kinase
MEYIEGWNLADGLQAEGVMTIEQACHTLSQVASALAAAHEKGIVHRDVKPDNVVRERDSDRVVLTDFGIAGILESGTETISRLTQQGQLLGDPRYTSPEQLLGESVTDESDVYSLGVMGYELLTFKAPYEGTTSVQLVTAHLKKEPIPLLSLRPDADPFLAELLERCLSKDPLHRPRASEVAKALERVTEEPHSPGPRMGSDSFSGQTLAEMAQDVSAFEGFFRELRRRRVFNVMFLYNVCRRDYSRDCSRNTSLSADPRGGSGYTDGCPGGSHAGELSGDSRSFVDVRYQREGNQSNRI